MTDEDIRAINRAIAEVEDQDIREAARTALHHVFGRESKLIEELQEVKEAADELTSAADYWQRKGMKLREENERLKAEQDNAGFIPWRLAQDSLEEYAAQVTGLQSRLSAAEERAGYERAQAGARAKKATDLEVKLKRAEEAYAKECEDHGDTRERLSTTEKQRDTLFRASSKREVKLADKLKQAEELAAKLDARLQVAEEQNAICLKYHNARSQLFEKLKRAEEVVEAAKALVRSGVLGGEEGDDIRDAIYRYGEGK